MLHRLSTLALAFLVFSCSKEVIQQKLTVDWTPLNGGTVSPPSNAFEKGSIVSMVATPAGEYTFKQWSGNLSGTSNPAPITMDADKQVTGVFEKRQYPLSLTIEGNGTVKEEVIALATQAQYPSGTTVRLTAQPAAKFEFGGWSGGLTSSANPLDVKVDKAISLKALFQQIKFPGYKVDPNARQLGFNYWHRGTGVMADLFVALFQKPLGNRSKYGTFFTGVTTGDFNNDGWVDVFNAGASFNGAQANFTFLMWNPTLKTFEEKNLFNDKSFSSFGGNKHTIKPFYINDDNFVDLVIFDNGDEGISNSKDEPVRYVLSDGKGGYDLKEVSTSEAESPVMKKEKGELGDLNGDGILDLVLPANMFIYIYWGQKDFPYFTQTNRAKFAGDFINFGNQTNNGFGEKVPNIAVNAYTTFIYDVNKDGKNDIFIGVGEEHFNNNGNKSNPKILINQGGGRFNSNSVVNLPFFYPNDDISNGVQDVIMEDLNGDGLNDFIAVNDQMYYNPNRWAPWEIFAYIQQKDGTYIIDKNLVEYNSTKRTGWKVHLNYFDYNGDGIKDLGYLDSADNGELATKTVFIRKGNKFIETDFYQFDDYAKGLLPTLKK
jgi:hypothetical protein